MRDYTRSYQTAYANLGNGQPATLFSSYDQQTVDTHFRWMQENGCDTAALQRFNPFGGEGADPRRDDRQGAHGRRGDAAASSTSCTTSPTGRTCSRRSRPTGPPRCRRTPRRRPTPGRTASRSCASGASASTTPAARSPRPPCLDVINWFKAQGCYVIGGVPTYWRQGINDSRPGFFDVYHAFNMISPWMVGRTGDLGGLDWFYNNVNVGRPGRVQRPRHRLPALRACPATCPPGTAGTATSTGGTSTTWSALGAQGIYISMFDEYNEGNQIAKTAENAALDARPTPASAPLDEDGTACSSDYYLRITADGGRMLKGQLALTADPADPADRRRPAARATSNLARGKADLGEQQPTAASPPPTRSTATPASYWESVNNAFPQWLQVDLGAAAHGQPRRAASCPPAGAPARRPCRFRAAPTVPPSPRSPARPGHVFNPATGNTVTITFPATSARYVRLNVTANTGWPAAQVLRVRGLRHAPAARRRHPAADRARQPDRHRQDHHQRLAVVAGLDGQRRGDRLPGAPRLCGRGHLAGTSHTVTGLTPNTSYSFTVTAQDAAGNTSGPSNTATTTTNPPGDTQPPSAPGNLTVTGKTTSSVSLSWQASTDNVAVTGYQVRQGSTVVATLAGTTHTVTGLNPNTSYSFTVTAQDAAGNTSPPSNTATTTTNPAPNTNLAQGKPATASSTTQSYGPGNAVDGNSSSYWESANNAFPQWLQVDLGATTAISRIVLKLPPPSAWGTRTQTLSVQGSTNGSSFSTVVGSTGYTFNPATGNTVTITFPSTSQRYVRLNFTGNTGWPAGQISEFEIYAS